MTHLTKYKSALALFALLAACGAALAAGADLGLFEIGEDERLAGRLELPDSGLELFCGVAANLGTEQHHKHVAFTYRPVVFVLQSRLR